MGYRKNFEVGAWADETCYFRACCSEVSPQSKIRIKARINELMDDADLFH